MSPNLRIARATNDLARLSEMYKAGLGLETLASFQDHNGFDGVMLGSLGCAYHLEFTQQAGFTAPRSHSAENLLIFYWPDRAERDRATRRMADAGFVVVPSHNPYWDSHGCTFEDPEGYRVVLSSNVWK